MARGRSSGPTTVDGALCACQTPTSGPRKLNVGGIARGFVADEKAKRIKLYLLPPIGQSRDAQTARPRAGGGLVAPSVQGGACGPREPDRAVRAPRGAAQVIGHGGQRRRLGLTSASHFQIGKPLFCRLRSKVRQTVEREFIAFLGNVQRVVAEAIAAHYESQEAEEEKERLSAKRMRLLEMLVDMGKARAAAVAKEEAEVGFARAMASDLEAQCDPNSLTSILLRQLRRQ